MNFSDALEQIKRGHKMKRTGWNGPDQFVEIQRPDDHSKMTLPYVYICTQQGDLVPWLVSQGDLMAEDWEYVSR